MDKNRKEKNEIVKKAQIAVSSKTLKKKKKRRQLLYEYFICLVALFGTALAVIDVFQGMNVWQQWVDHFILIFLTLDYVIRLIISRDKKLFFKENIFNLVAIIPFVPTLRIFRVTRLAKLLRLSIIGAFPKKAFRKAWIFLNTNGFKSVLIFTSLAILFGAFGIMYTEGMKFGDAIWWAFVTATTVGYGDLSPSTSLGRVIAAILMIFGIGLIGSITSTITSYFLRIDSKSYKEETLELIKKKIDDISNLTDEDIDAICKVLKTMNKNSIKKL